MLIFTKFIWFHSDSLCSVSSVIYAMLLIGFGIALPLFDILLSDDSSIKGENDAMSNIFEVYYISLYLLSVAFILFISYVTGSFSQNNDAAQNGIDTYFGSSLLRNSGILFGIITIIYSCLAAFTEEPRSMAQMVSLVRVLLTLAQIAFIFNTKIEIIPRMRVWRKISSFGLMHIVATNVCEWIYIIISEAREDNDKSHSMESGDLKKDAAYFLYPFSVEYNLICALVAYETWKKVNSTNNFTVHPFKYGDILPKSSYALIVSLVQLSATIIIATLFFYNGHPILLIEIYRLIITCVAIVLLYYTMYSTRKMQENVSLRDNYDERQKIKLDSALLMTSLFGAFLLSIFNMIVHAQSLKKYNKSEDTVGFALEIVTIVEKSTQTLLILNLYLKKTTESDKFGNIKDIVKVLLISNFSLWIINVFINNIVYPDGNHNNTLSHSAWIVLTRMTLPSAIFYRFHAVVCYFEILKNVFDFT